ncbi:MAG: HAMP domain-containing sensor histidine kinase [Candidatus Paceibacterota bacterium]|jgi:signal transduction histidine kinase
MIVMYALFFIVGALLSWLLFIASGLADKNKNGEGMAISLHQLRTPVTKIKWIFDELSSEHPDNAPGLIAHGQTISGEMLSIINDTLTEAALDNKRKKFQFKKGDLHNLVDDIVKNYNFLAEQKGITISMITPDTKIPPFVFDKDKITLAIRNLLDNAISYTQKNGTVEITVRPSNGLAQIIIKDSGIGIPKEHLPNLFKKFSRAENAKKFSEQGSGLGLYIVKSIINGHRGMIFVQSTEGKGTTVTIELPLDLETKYGDLCS